MALGSINASTWSSDYAYAWDLPFQCCTVCMYNLGATSVPTELDIFSTQKNLKKMSVLGNGQCSFSSGAGELWANKLIWKMYGSDIWAAENRTHQQVRWTIDITSRCRRQSMPWWDECSQKTKQTAAMGFWCLVPRKKHQRAPCMPHNRMWELLQRESSVILSINETRFCKKGSIGWFSFIVNSNDSKEKR